MVTIIKLISTILCVFLIQPHLAFQEKMENTHLTSVSQAECGVDRIHFMNTGSSDAILLESDGHFALIDAGEDSDNPRNLPGLELEGFEERVLQYLKDNAADENGKVYLDFVLGTHSHSDHIGGFDTVISDPDVDVGRAYLKVYDSSKIKKEEVEEWDNQEVYDQMVNALNAKNVPIISKPDGTPFKFGNFTITLFNTDDPKPVGKVGENDQSFGVLVEKNGTRVFLAGDMDNVTLDETRLARKIGKVDLLKVGHHSYQRSSSEVFIRTLMPKTCVVTNNFGSIHMPTMYNLIRVCDPDILITGKENGVIADIGDNGNISYYGEIHPNVTADPVIISDVTDVAADIVS